MKDMIQQQVADLIARHDPTRQFVDDGDGPNKWNIGADSPINVPVEAILKPVFKQNPAIFVGAGI